MRTRTMYVCEVCGKTSSSAKEIHQCEASHYGLMVEEFDYWTYLKNQVRDCSITVSNTKNEVTDAALDKAIAKLLVFEKEHKLQEKQEVLNG